MTRPMRIALWLLSALVMGACSDSDNSLSTTETTTAVNDEAAVIIVDNVALETGGVLDAVERTLNEADLGTLLDRADQPVSKDFATAEMVFDSTTCTWTQSRERSREGEFAGHSWQGVRTIHLMDENGDCVERRDSLGTVKGMDTTFDFEGSSWNRRGSWENSGMDQWQIRELNDEIAGALVNGGHSRAGSGEMVIGDATRTYEFTMTLAATDLRIVIVDGRRVPVEGTIVIIYDAVRNGEVIHREATITFGSNGGEVVIGNGSYGFDPVSGTLD